MAARSGIDLRGGNELAKLAARAEKLGDRALKNKLVGQIKKTSRPIANEVKKRFGEDEALPHKGGFDASVRSKLRINTKVRAQPSKYEAAGVRLIAAMERPSSAATRKNARAAKQKAPKSKFFNLPGLNAGHIRHPLFGNRRFWFDQEITPGIWARSVDPSAQRMSDAVYKAMDDFRSDLANFKK